MKQIKVLIFELIMFLVVQLIGVYAALSFIKIKPEITQQSVSLLSFVIAFFIATVTIIIALKFFRGKFGFKLLFVFIVLIGSKAIFELFVSSVLASVLALAVVAAWVIIPYILIHNIAVILAIAGIGSILGLQVSVPVILILISILSIYDVLAVFKTKHMVKIFKSMMDRGVILSIIVPTYLSDMFNRVDRVRPGHGFMLLGTGDLAFPLIFAASVVKISLISSLYVIAGATIGAAIVFYLLVSQAQRKPLPALPPIAIFSMIGFFVSLI